MYIAAIDSRRYHCSSILDSKDLDGSRKLAAKLISSRGDNEINPMLLKVLSLLGSHWVWWWLGTEIALKSGHSNILSLDSFP